MIIERIDHSVEQILARYRNLAASLAGEFARTLESLDPTSSLSRQSYMSRARGHVAAFTHSIIGQLAAASTQARDAARAEPLSKIDPVLAARIEDAAESITLALAQQAERDMHAGRDALARFGIEVAMVMGRSGRARCAAIVHVREQNRRGLELTFMDRAGRRWSSERFVQTLSRGHLLQVYNETVLFELTAAGEQHARVHAPGRPEHGLRFRILDEGERSLPRYEDLVETLFHPNTQAVVAPESTWQS